MPFVNIENSGKGNNKGSCRALVNYLCKENQGKPLSEHEHFFSSSQDQINRLTVMNSIDSNVAKLGRSDSKFFMLTLNFSDREVRHIQNDRGKIRQYTREVMELYAKNFNKGLHSKDLVWYAKIEFNRAFKGFEPEVLSGISQQGQLKPGNNTHVHLIISRKDITQKLKLSPMTNHRKSSGGVIRSGFDRMQFKIDSEHAFDQLFSYKRDHADYLLVANTLKNGTREQKREVKFAIHRKQSPLVATLRALNRAIQNDPNEDDQERRRKSRDQGYSY